MAHSGNGNGIAWTGNHSRIGLLFLIFQSNHSGMGMRFFKTFGELEWEWLKSNMFSYICYVISNNPMCILRFFLQDFFSI